MHTRTIGREMKVIFRYLTSYQPFMTVFIHFLRISAVVEADYKTFGIRRRDSVITDDVSLLAAGVVVKVLPTDVPELYVLQFQRYAKTISKKQKKGWQDVNDVRYETR